MKHAIHIKDSEGLVSEPKSRPPLKGVREKLFLMRSSTQAPTGRRSSLPRLSLPAMPTRKPLHHPTTPITDGHPPCARARQHPCEWQVWMVVGMIFSGVLPQRGLQPLLSCKVSSSPPDHTSYVFCTRSSTVFKKAFEDKVIRMASLRDESSLPLQSFECTAALLKKHKDFTRVFLSFYTPSRYVQLWKTRCTTMMAGYQHRRGASVEGNRSRKCLIKPHS